MHIICADKAKTGTTRMGGADQREPHVTLSKSNCIVNWNLMGPGDPHDLTNDLTNTFVGRLISIQTEIQAEILSAND